MNQECKFVLNDLTTYRSELMGWSIIWVMMLHFQFITLKPLGFIAQYGFAGVDIFMLVSGLGLYYSLKKTPSLAQFYAKRLKRIFPAYYFIGLFASVLLFQDDILTYLYRFSTIGFWTSGPFFEWYIPSIVMLYLLAPGIYHVLSSRVSWILTVLCILIIVASYFEVKSPSISDQHFFFLYRIPEFIGGMACGKMITEGVSPRKFLLLAILGIPFFVLLFPQHHNIYAFKYLSLFFLLPLFVILICIVGKKLKSINLIIRKVGNASLEIYLIQTLFFSAFCNGQLKVSDSWHDLTTIAIIVFCTLAGILHHHLIGNVKFLR